MSKGLPGRFSSSPTAIRFGEASILLPRCLTRAPRWPKNQATVAWPRHRLDTDHDEDETLSDEDVAADVAARTIGSPALEASDDQRRR